MFNPDNQYRCTIIRGKAQNDLDNLLPAYASIVSQICPADKSIFDKQFNDNLSNIIYSNLFDNISVNHQKTIRNPITEIAGKLFGLFYLKYGIVFESESTTKLLTDNDQPAFFKNICLNFQFPNGTQAIQTVEERVNDEINLKPFHFIVSLLNLAKKNKITITKDEIGYYVLNAIEVLQGKISIEEVFDVIINDRKSGVNKKLESGSYHTQHIREQLNLLALANLIFINKDSVHLNSFEAKTISIFLSTLNTAPGFNIKKYDLQSPKERKLMYSDWAEYFGKINVEDYEILHTSIESLQRNKVEDVPKTKKGTDHTILGDAGEEFVFELEKERVKRYNHESTPKKANIGISHTMNYVTG